MKKCVCICQEKPVDPNLCSFYRKFVFTGTFWWKWPTCDILSCLQINLNFRLLNAIYWLRLVEVVGCIVSITPIGSTVQPANFPELIPFRRLLETHSAQCFRVYTCLYCN